VLYCGLALAAGFATGLYRETGRWRKGPVCGNSHPHRRHTVGKGPDKRRCYGKPGFGPAARKAAQLRERAAKPSRS
jgi:hypothetical protein